MLYKLLRSIPAVEEWVDKSLKIEYNILIGQRIKIGSSYSSKGIDSTAHIFTITRKMIRTTMCEDTELSLLQSQLTHYLMVEKYGLRNDAVATFEPMGSDTFMSEEDD